MPPNSERLRPWTHTPETPQESPCPLFDGTCPYPAGPEFTVTAPPRADGTLTVIE